MGGLRPSSAALVGRVGRQLASRGCAVHTVPCLESVTRMELPRACGIVNLSDLDKPALQDPTEASLDGLKRLFEHPRTVLWVTSGCADDAPLQNMSVGLGRVIMTEMPAGRLQFLDLGSHLGPDSASVISASFLRRMALSDLDTDLEAGTLLWSRESELFYSAAGGGFKVPRLAFDETMNTRYMASRQPTARQVSIKDVPVALVDRDGNGGGAGWDFAEQATSPLAGPASRPSIRVDISSLAPCYSGFHVAVGEYAESGDAVVALSKASQSIIESPAATVAMGRTIPREAWPQAASLLTREMHVASIMDRIPCGAVVLLWEPPTELAMRLRERQSEKAVDFVFLTLSGRAPRKEFPWTVVHRNLTSRQIRFLIPGLDATAVLIDCSTTPSSAYKSTFGFDRALPQSVWRTSVVGIASRRAVATGDASKLLASAYRNVTLEISSAACSEYVLPTMALKRCDELDTATASHDSSNLLIDWWNSSQVTARVAPVDGFLRFSEDKTYVLYGLTSDLGQSIAEWLATRGARHIALASRNPKVSEEWIASMTAGGVDCKVFSR